MTAGRSVTDLLAPYPRAGILKLAAIVHRLPRLSAAIGHDIHVLRDDLTGFGLGGNKTRKLDYLIGDAIRCGADVLITQKATSLSRNAAAAAAVCGLELHVVVPGSAADHNPLSRAFFDQFGATLHYMAAPDRSPDQSEEAVCEELGDTFRSEGRAVYHLHPGGSDAIGALGDVQAFDEIVDAAERSGLHFSHIIHSSGSAGTQAGLLVGQSLRPVPCRIIGISARLEAAEQEARVLELAKTTAGLFDTGLDPSNVVVDDGHIGPGYAIPSEEGTAAAALFARTEGLMLDPVYGAKAAAALLDQVSGGELGSGAVLFIHTGGNAGLFY